MLRLLERKISLGATVNPFYLYCISFTIALIVYLWRWSSIFPDLSLALILFFFVSFILFFITGRFIVMRINIKWIIKDHYKFLNDIIFSIIIVLGVINVIGMGYLPVLDLSHDYREFGVPVIDPIFNSLSIFFSVFFFQSFLRTKKMRFIIYVLIILLFQFLIFRRSSIVWIITSSVFLFLLYRSRVSILVVLFGLLSIPVFSYYFGLYGNKRSKLSKSYILNDLGSSDSYKESGLGDNHYMTYLYLSSPLANLQNNIDKGVGFLNKKDFKDFFFYCLLPGSITLRLENKYHLVPPDCDLIMPDLIVGTYFMLGFYTLGWLGMIAMLIFLLAFILISLLLLQRFKTFNITTFCILSTAVSLLIFSNFLNRLDVILMLFIYPVLFHLIFEKARIKVNSV